MEGEEGDGERVQPAKADRPAGAGRELAGWECGGKGGGGEGDALGGSGGAGGGALIFATIQALAILRAKAAARKAARFLVEEKALRWLQTQAVETERLLSRVLAEL
jgi:hypothetical protein